MNKIEFGDCREIMRRWASEGIKVQTCVTSPPYFGLRDYGHEGQIGLEQTPEEYIAAMVEVFRCVWDVLADDGTLWLNLGDSYGSVGGNTYSGFNERWSGTGGFGSKQNSTLLGVTNRKINTGLKAKNLLGIPWRVALALQSEGWILRQDIIWHKPNPMPESVRDRCTKAHEYIFLLSKSERYYYDTESVAEPITDSSAIRLLQKTENQHGSDRVPGKTNGAMKAVGRKPFTNDMAGGGSGMVGHSGYLRADGTMMIKPTRNRRSVWTVTTKPYKGAHFATYPPDLIEPCILAGSREGDIVLDPFMGSGTTAAVSIKNGRRYLGCELNPSYGELQEQRIKESQPEESLQIDMFSNA
jgi:DNA modification methylase